MKKKKIRYILLIAIIVAANQVSEAKAGSIRDHETDQANNSIDRLFNARKNPLYVTK